MSAPPDRGERGFTLLELLVAITLLGLLMVALFGGLQVGVRAWEVGDERLHDGARLQIVQDFLRERLSQAYPLEVLDPTGIARLAFRGERDGANFVTVLPEHLGAGVYRFSLRLIERDRRRHVALAWYPFAAAPGKEEEQPAGERLLVPDVADLQLAYFGAPSEREPPAWYDSWNPALPHMPVLIRIRIAFGADDRRSWPDLIVRPMIDAGFFQRF